MVSARAASGLAHAVRVFRHLLLRQELEADFHFCFQFLFTSDGEALREGFLHELQAGQYTLGLCSG